jgi:hypothetical protein
VLPFLVLNSPLPIFNSPFVSIALELQSLLVVSGNLLNKRGLVAISSAIASSR